MAKSKTPIIPSQNSAVEKPERKNAPKSAKDTPMIQQYLALKDRAPNCLLFYRMGDFFELFFDDAKIASAVLDIALTSRGSKSAEPVPMCGVPAHSAEGYLAKLIRAGHKVAIAEQIETPEQAKKRGGSKALVAREITRYVTAGTLTEENLLDARSDNLLLAIGRAGDLIGLAYCDISSGKFTLAPIAPEQIDAEIARLEPSELIQSEDLAIFHPEAEQRPNDDFESREGEAKLKALFGLATLDGLGAFGRGELAAAAGLLAYLDHVGRGKLPFLQPPSRHEHSGHMLIDAASRESLELTRSAQGNRQGSLLAAIDRSVTGAGARMLASDLSAPLINLSQINDRLALVGWIHADSLLRSQLREDLKSIPDLARGLGRLVAGRGSPRDLGQVRDALIAAQQIHENFSLTDNLPPLLLRLLPQLSGHGALIDQLSAALVESPPTDRGQGGYIAKGYDAALDQLRETSGNARRAIAALEARYREQTGMNALKIRHNAVLGYYIEVPPRHADKLMAEDSGFTHRQTLAGAVRFNSSALHEEALRIAQSGGHALAAEEAHFEELNAAVLQSRETIANSAAALARIDVAAALAELAAERSWSAPIMDDAPILEVESGRHPVVEAALAKMGEPFVANPCALSPEDRLWLISGPNMGGKSTFLRQNALIIILAQMGSFVPAARAKIGIVDRLFSRVGASDNLVRGRSTFMVEMVETAAILSGATERSFVILDEVGRGTSTYDGLALAWAVVEAIHEQNRCRCLFATHYHELTRLSEQLDALSLRHVRAREWQGDLVLLHELAEGPADRSYGLAVAKLAGISPKVVGRAKIILEKLEAGRAATGGLAAGLDDLPLFAKMIVESAEPEDPLRETLSSVDIDALSPRDALELLYRLKDLTDNAAS